MNATPLLDWTPPIRVYPYRAGYQKPESSRLAAERMDADSWKKWAHDTAYFLIRVTPSTVKELLAEMYSRYPERMSRRDINSLRPRITELRTKNLIEESGERRDGQTVWMVTA